MPSRPWTAALVFCAVSLGVGSALAQEHELRCKGRLIDTGASLGYVLDRCGMPLERSASDVPVRALNPDGTTRVIGTTRIERLVYDRGWGRFPAELEFEDGVLQSIEYLTRRRGGAAR